MESAGAGVPPEQKITLRTYGPMNRRGFTVYFFDWLSVQSFGVIGVILKTSRSPQTRHLPTGPISAPS